MTSTQKKLSKFSFFKRPRKHPYLSGAALSVFLFFMASFGLVVVSAETIGPDDIKIVDLYQSGNVRSVPTRAKTVGEFLKQQNIVLAENDLVEPAVTSEIRSEEFEVSLFKARPLRITDGSQTKRHLSGYTDLRLAANQLGYDLDPADEINQLNDDSLDIGRAAVITRANSYTVNVYGQVLNVKSQSDSVNEVLAQAGVDVLEGDTIRPEAGTALLDGDQITVSRFGTEIVTVEEDIAFDTETITDDSLTSTQTIVDTPGQVGKKSVIYEITLENEVEVDRTVIQEVVLEEPVTKIQRRGTKPPVVSSNNVGADRQFLMAAAGIAESDWGYVDYIINRESTWNAAAVNPIGCIGLGQNCPNRNGYYWLKDACPDWQTNPVCQLQRFSGYANSRYGGWGNAYSAWLRQGWW